LSSYNKVLLMGHLTRDCELRFSQSGSAVCKFGLAVNRKYKAGDDWKEEVCFVDVTVFGKQGENCAEYTHKGDPVFIEGRLQFSTWETEEGQKRNKLEVIGERVQFLSKKNNDDIPF